VTVAGLLALVAAGLGIWLWQHEPDSVTPRPAKSGEPIVVPADRPVLLSAADAQEAVAAGAEAASTIVATSYQDYDEQVEEAASLMTEEFAAEYRQTAADVRQKILDSKTEVQVTIVAQGVVRANTSEVEALLFLNQYSSKGGGKTTYTPYRALVTVVHTNTGWLVSGLDTQ
jgi:Mce-associated membrane protein